MRDPVDAMRRISALVGVFVLTIQADYALAIEALDQKSLQNFDAIGSSHSDYKFKISSCFMFDLVGAEVVSEKSGKSRRTILFKDNYYEEYSNRFFKFLGDEYESYINRDPKSRVKEMSDNCLLQLVIKGLPRRF